MHDDDTLPPLHVLLVDDDEEQQRLAASALRAVGCRIDLASTGAEAVRTFTTEVPDLVVMDAAMPVMDGIEATRRMRALRVSKRAHIVLFSGHTDARTRELAFESGCDQFVTKPYDVERVIQRYTARMGSLVGDLLDLVSIEAGRLAVVPERHDAMELLTEALDIFQPQASAKNISCRATYARGSLLARYDHDRILQVLGNLLGNAIKFTQSAGSVDIIVEATGSDVCSL